MAPSSPEPSGGVADAVRGFGLHFEGLRLLRQQRALWRLAVVPLLLAVSCFAVATFFLVSYAGALHGFVTGWMPELVAGAWYSWLWIGPAKFLLMLLGALLFVALVGVCWIVAFLLASVLASPFHDALARRVELLVSGQVIETEDSGITAILREGGRSVLEELRRLFFFVLIQLTISFFGFVIPGGQLVAPPLMVAVTILFLPLDYASYTLDRRRVPFRDKRRWIAGHRFAMLGFGAGAFLTLLIPGLNFIAMPGLVVSGTLLALRFPVR